MRFPPIPTSVPPELGEFFRTLSLFIQQGFKERVPNTQATDALLLVSPTGKVYSVQVDDVGALSTTLVRE